MIQAVVPRRATEVRRTTARDPSARARLKRLPLRSRATSNDSRAAGTAADWDWSGERHETVRRDRSLPAGPVRATDGRSRGLRAEHLWAEATSARVSRWSTAAPPGTETVSWAPARVQPSRPAP